MSNGGKSRVMTHKVKRKESASKYLCVLYCGEEGKEEAKVHPFGAVELTKKATKEKGGERRREMDVHCAIDTINSLYFPRSIHIMASTV